MDVTNWRPGYAKQGLMLLSFLGMSTSSYALPATLQTLPAEQFTYLSYGVAGLFGVLLIFLLAGKISRSRLNKKLLSASAHQDVLQERMDGMTVGMLCADVDMQITYANRTGAYLLGQKAQQMLNQPLASFLPADCFELIEKAKTANRELTMQVTLPGRDRNYRIRINPALSQVAQAKVMVLIEDVEDYQQQLDASANMQSHLSALFQQQSLGFITVDISNQCLVINETLAAWLQLNAQQVTIEQFYQYVSEHDKGALARAVEQLAGGQNIELELRLSAANGTAIPVLLTGSLAAHTSETSNPIAHLALTDLRQINEARKERELAKQRHVSLFSAITQPVYQLDEQGRFVECNKAFCALFNTEQMRIKGQKISDVESFDESFKNIHQLNDLVVSKQTQLTTTRNDGELLSLTVNLHPIAEEGHHAGLLAVIDDATEITALQKQASTAKARLNMFINQSPMGVVLFDGNNTVKEVNTTLCRQLDLTAHDVQGKSFYDLLNRSEEANKLADKLQRHDKVSEFPARLNGGMNKTLTTTIYASKISEIPEEYVCWIGSREEQEYLNSRFDRLLKYASVPVALLSDQGFTQLNSNACAFFGVKDEDELLGKKLSDGAINEPHANLELLNQKLETVKTKGQVMTVSWQHRYNEHTLPCELTLIPILRNQSLQGIICMWVDLRAVEQAKAARAEAVKLREAAEREVEEQQQLLATSEHKLAEQTQTLAETEQNLMQTEQRLHNAEVTLSEKVETISDLQKAHKDISEHLNNLKADYANNRQLLEESQQANASLEAQLEESSVKVGSLQKQRNQIADALQYSERKYRESQEQLEQSQKETKRLKVQQSEQQQAVEQYEAQILSLEASIADKDKQISDVSGQISSLQSQLSSSGEATEKLREQLINQRKASEQAERERRELEMAFLQAQSEAEGKARRIEHLQHEMQALETMSQQEKGDMEAHAAQLAKELENKQSQLSATESALADIKKQSEQDKQEKAAQQERLAQLQNDLADIESRSQQQQAKVAEADAKWKAQQEALRQALEAKQRELQQTEHILSEAKQQTEAEKQEKARQQAIFAKLKEELASMEQKAHQQQSAVKQSEQKWLSEQEALARELEQKQAKLAAAETELENRQKQMDAEKLERESQQSKLAQLKSELADVAQRAAKQKEMMLGSDEQWRRHHEEIEAQKQQLQQALSEAQAQNSAMQNKLKSSMSELASAEEKVSLTQSEEQKLQNELNAAREEAEQLQTRLAQQEAQEAKLQEQVKAQQSALQSSQSSIEQLEQQQKALTEKLATVQKEYAATQQSISQQNSSQSELTAQLSSLESELSQRKTQLESKEKALEQAQAKLKDSESKLAEQEQALVEAQKVELHKAQAEAPPVRDVPDYAHLTMPPDPSVWFDLLQYLQSNKQVSSMANSLTSLMDDLSGAVDEMDNAVMEDNARGIMLATRKLIMIIKTVNSAPLNDMESRLSMDVEQGNFDNISIFWPMAKQNLERTLRVIYSHLYDD